MMRSSSAERRRNPSEWNAWNAMPEISATHSGLSRSRPSLELTHFKVEVETPGWGQAKGSSHSSRTNDSTHITHLYGFMMFHVFTACFHNLLIDMFKRNNVGVCLDCLCHHVCVHLFDIIWHSGEATQHAASLFLCLPHRSLKQHETCVKHSTSLRNFRLNEESVASKMSILAPTCFDTLTYGAGLLVSGNHRW